MNPEEEFNHNYLLTISKNHWVEGMTCILRLINEAHAEHRKSRLNA